MPSAILVEFEAQIQVDDIVYVYYLQEGNKTWSDEFSVYNRVEGRVEKQKLQFKLPVDKPLEGLRLDIGSNREQKPISINSLTLKSESAVYVLDNAILLDYFKLNEYLFYKDGKYHPKILFDRYDPFLTSKKEVYKILEILRTPKTSFREFSTYYVSALLAVIFFFILYFFRKLRFVKGNRRAVGSALIVGVLGFLGLFIVLKNSLVIPSKALVEMDVTVLENDIFYVYYLREGDKKWSDENSVNIRLKGNKNPQTLKFELPVNESIQNLRLDIGANQFQKPMLINSVTITSETGGYKFDKNLLNYFNPNEYITILDDRYQPEIIGGRYDPFLVSNPKISHVLKEISTPQKLFSIWTCYTIATIFSVAIFAFMLNYSIHFYKRDLFILASCFLLLLPTIVRTFDISSSGMSLEKRELAKMPKFSSFIQFPGEFEKYYSDNFGFRNEMIEVSGKIKVNLFNASPKPELVQFGKNKFLFYNSFDDEIYKSYTHLDLVTDVELKNIFNKWKKRDSILSKRNISYISGFWPNKHSIYPENLPNSMAMQIRGNISLADQVYNFSKEADFFFFDVRQDLLEKKECQDIYRKLDSHWNNYGAYFAYRSFCKSTFTKLGITPFEQDEFRINYSESNEGDLSNMLGVKSIFGLKENLPEFVLKDKSKGFLKTMGTGILSGMVVTRNENIDNDLKVLVFRDSFGSALIQFFSLHFKEVVYVSSDYNDDLVDKIQPNIVISCRVERYLLSL